MSKVRVTKIRVDQLLTDRGLAPSRTRAQALVLAGKVFHGETRIDKPGTTLPDDAEVTVRGEDHGYVSRGGVKLAGALDVFCMQVTDLRCLDVGASTGGFTDCLLQRGASAVVAVDVGYGQLAHKLRVDPRVTVMERTNARAIGPADIGGAVDLTVVDASFIGLGQLIDAIAACTKPGGALVALIKPQFEVGRDDAKKAKGVIRDAELRKAAIDNAVSGVKDAGFQIVAECDSSLPGPKGNVEAFVYARRT
jgi:23S rRNA (cytidine1920-2'-O)/16S rRNA (cytidine1409-2'-O)-methyltransferase